MSVDQGEHLFLHAEHGGFVVTWRKFWLYLTSIAREPRFSCLVPWPKTIRL